MRQKVKSLEDTGRIAKKSNKQKKQKQEHTKEQNIRTDKERGKNTSAAFTCLSDVPTSQVWKSFFWLQSRKSKGKRIMLARKYISQICMFWSGHLFSFVHHVPALLLHRINTLLNTQGAMNKWKTGVHSQRSGKKTKTWSGKLQHDTKGWIPQNKTGNQNHDKEWICTLFSPFMKKISHFLQCLKWANVLLLLLL